MNQVRREKRTAPITVHLVPSARQALEQLASHEGRSLSTAVALVLQRDPIFRALTERHGQP